MSAPFAGWIARSEAAALARLFGRAGLHVRADGERVWLRALAPDAELERALARIDFAQRFELRGDTSSQLELVRPGGCAPRGRLEPEGWSALSGWIAAELPRARLAPRPAASVRLRLARGGAPRPADAALLAWERFARWADTASELRLAPLRFALSADGRALVTGRPAPPLPGTQLVREGALLVPCGFALDPPVDSACAQRALGLASGELALFTSEDRFEVVPEEAFVAATRAAVRTTAAELAR